MTATAQLWPDDEAVRYTNLMMMSVECGQLFQMRIQVLNHNVGRVWAGVSNVKTCRRWIRLELV